jgi:hypothetical protein
MTYYRLLRRCRIIRRSGKFICCVPPLRRSAKSAIGPHAVVKPKQAGYHGARHTLGEVKLDLTFGPIARDQRVINRGIPVLEQGCLYDVSLRYRIYRSRKLAQIGAGRQRST